MRSFGLVVLVICLMGCQDLLVKARPDGAALGLEHLDMAIGYFVLLWVLGAAVLGTWSARLEGWHPWLLSLPSPSARSGLGIPPCRWTCRCG